MQHKLKSQEAEFITHILNTFLIFGKDKRILAPHNATFHFASRNNVTIAFGIIIVEVWNPILQAHMRTDYRNPYRFFADYNGWQENPLKGIEKAFKKLIEK